MPKSNIKASSSIMSDKQFILSDFIPEFVKFRRNEDKKRIGCESIDDSLFVLPKKDHMYFKPVTPICNKCNSRNLVKYGTYTRELIFLDIGKKTCIIQKYKCKKCGHITYTNMSSIVNYNSNITIPVINHIEHLYSYFNGSLHKIRDNLKKEYNVDISYQSVENIILKSHYTNKEEKCLLFWLLFV